MRKLAVQIIHHFNSYSRQLHDGWYDARLALGVDPHLRDEHLEFISCYKRRNV